MKKRVFLLFTTVLTLLLLCAATGVYAAENESMIFTYANTPVLLKYAANENRCAIIADERSGTASITDMRGDVLKTYKEVPFLNGQPVLDAGVLQTDMGWTACAHAPNTDMFESEGDAVAAGAFTYMKNAENAEIIFYVGRCYAGWYFSGVEGEHGKKCPHDYIVGDMVEFSVTIENGKIEYEFIGTNDGEIDIQAENHFEEAVQSSFSPEDFHPVLIEYLLRKDGVRYSYTSENSIINVYGEDGSLTTSFKYVPRLYGSLAVDSAVLFRAGFSSVHEPVTDLFDSETDALTAGWLEYCRESENSSCSFNIGYCGRGGYYFSRLPDEHEMVCVSAYDRPEYSVTIENGVLSHDGVVRDAAGAELAQYAREYGDVTQDKPAESLTKMVILFHSEYAKPEGVQSLYFLMRDRVYRDYWEDVASYDVTDYVFIAPDFPILGDYTEFNNKTAGETAAAVLALLKHDKNAKIWLGTPGITSTNYNHDKITAETSADYLKKVKAGLCSNEIWNNNVAGVYMNQESVYPDDVKGQIDRIKETVALAKQTDRTKKALWIPYYDLAEGSVQISERISEVAKIPNLFDYIVIQPGYFFFGRTDGALDPGTTAHRRSNLGAVSSSAENNYVADASGLPVNYTTAYAAIGLEMEPQASYFSNSMATRGESLDRYTQYLIAGARIKETSPIVYYASGDPHCNREALIYKFYDADKLSADAVRKKLDVGLERFYSYVFATREKEKVLREYAKALYLAADAANTEESFEKDYNAAVIIPEFYKYEKRVNIGCESDIGDISEYIEANGTLPDSFNEILLGIWGYWEY